MMKTFLKSFLSSNRSKRSVYLGQIYESERRIPILPYSVGLIWAYAQSFLKIRENYELKEILVIRRPPEEYVNQMVNPDVLALSCYLWNWEYNLELARLTKMKFPDTVVIFGGPQISSEDSEKLSALRDVDFFVHGDGEEAFKSLLLALLDKQESFDQIDGLIFRNEGKTMVTKKPERIANLNDIPSPYQLGLFDKILDDYPVKWAAVWETNRGCPYSCTFCIWGDPDTHRISQWDINQVIGDLDWFSEHKIDRLYGADANFGILPRDSQLIDHLISNYKSTGYPKQIGMNWAKRSNRKIFEMSEKLLKAGLANGTTFAVQSLDEETLKHVERDNISFSNLEDWISKYQKAGIPTYSQVILGLPGETLESFKKGLCKLMESGIHDNVQVFYAMMLNNSKMKSQISEFGIRTSRIKMIPHFGDQLIDEYVDIITQTNTLSHEDWIECYGFKTLTIGLHYTGLTSEVSKFFARQAQGGYYSFYQFIYERTKSEPNSHIGSALQWIFRNPVTNDSPHWPEICNGILRIESYEESYIYALLTQDIEKLFKELLVLSKEYAEFIEVDLPTGLFTDLFAFQRAISIGTSMAEYPIQIELEYNIPEVINTGAPLTEKRTNVEVSKKDPNHKLPAEFNERCMEITVGRARKEGLSRGKYTELIQ
jgi:putative methyltransferase